MKIHKNLRKYEEIWIRLAKSYQKICKKLYEFIYAFLAARISQTKRTDSTTADGVPMWIDGREYAHRRWDKWWGQQLHQLQERWHILEKFASYRGTCIVLEKYGGRERGTRVCFGKICNCWTDNFFLWSDSENIPIQTLKFNTFFTHTCRNHSSGTLGPDKPNKNRCITCASLQSTNS